jgi:hypothetical protein
MPMKELLPKIGSWSFIFGFVIAIIAGFWQASGALLSVLVILGIIVGFLNIQGRDAMKFLLASVSLVVISSMGHQAFSVVGTYFGRMLVNLIVFTTPAAAIVALRVIFTLGYRK